MMRFYRSSPIRLWPIKNQLTMFIESTKACFEDLQHRFIFFRGVTTLDRTFDGLALTGDMVFEFGDAQLNPC